jgi:hypothetical protein
MLRLLAQREQGYEDIAALMGLSVEQVRERVSDALKQLEEEGKPVPEPPAPPPAEELRPTGPVAGDDSSSSRAAGEEPSPTPPAGGGSAEETVAVPAAEEQAPSAVEPPGAEKASDAKAAEVAAGATSPQPGDRSTAGRAKQPRSGPPKVSMPQSNGARAAIGAGVAAVVVLIVVLIVGGSGGDSSSSTTASSPAAATRSAETTESTSSSEAKQVTKAVLGPVGGSEATGVAIFGRVKNSLALQVEAEGLSPTDSAHSYAIWLAQSPQKMLPLASTAVKSDGRIAAQFEVPTEVLAYLANEAFGQIVVTEVAESTLKAALKKAASEKKAPSYTGTPVLEGTVTGPIVGAAKRAKTKK